MATRIVEKTKPNGLIVYIIQRRFLLWWCTIRYFDGDIHGTGCEYDLEFESIEKAEQYLKSDTYKIVKHL